VHDKRLATAALDDWTEEDAIAVLAWPRVKNPDLCERAANSAMLTLDHVNPTLTLGLEVR
jgi:hypothetical protein